jgi:hypothetical protein
MKFVRDINTVGRKERIAAGVVSTVVGSALIVWQETSEGSAIEDSLLRVGVALVMGVVACVAYGRYQKAKAQDRKENSSGSLMDSVEE